MKPVIARNLVIGEGAPKTIVSLMDATVDQAIQTGKLAIASGADCLEWRADFCANVTDIAAMEADAQALRSALPDTPLLFTFRSADQGGQMELPFDQYFDLTEAMINTGAFDLVDVESRTGDERVSALTDLARKKKRCQRRFSPRLRKDTLQRMDGWRNAAHARDGRRYSEDSRNGYLRSRYTRPAFRHRGNAAPPRRCPPYHYGYGALGSLVAPYRRSLRVGHDILRFESRFGSRAG